LFLYNPRRMVLVEMRTFLAVVFAVFLDMICLLSSFKSGGIAAIDN
jgi:hypothetical protein